MLYDGGNSVSSRTVSTTSLVASVSVETVDGRSPEELIHDVKCEITDTQRAVREEERVIEKLARFVESAKSRLLEQRSKAEEAKSWQSALLTTSQRWLSLWEGDFGKKLLDHRSAKTAENALLLSSVTQQVEYGRHWIAIFRRRKQEREAYGPMLCEEARREAEIMAREVHDLRLDCMTWERRAAVHKAYLEAAGRRNRALIAAVREREMAVDEVKADINEFERELLTASYTLDQFISF